MSIDIWIVDDDQSIRWVLERTLREANLQTTSFCSADDALRAFPNQQPSCIITDIKMPGISGIEFMKQVHAKQPSIPIIVITAHADLDSAILAYDGGAFEYLPKPFDIDDVVQIVNQALALKQQDANNEPTKKTAKPIEMIGESSAMQALYRMIGRLSKTDINILISGQSGTGKELVARALHRYSPRQDQAFIALNMAAIPGQLLESELFGHEKGAFTGAQSQRKGRFEQAHGGTLFLDEIGDMPMDLQTRLLRVLSEGSFYRLGGHTAIKVDTRIIAATHQNLERLIEKGLFREDLYHRINVIKISVPALKERADDIPLLMNHFLQTTAKSLAQEPKVLSPDVEHFLMAKPWPGNVRQLENLCRWLSVMASGHVINKEDLPSESDDPSSTQDDWEAQLRSWAKNHLHQHKASLLDTALPKFETILIKAALTHTKGRKQDAAKRLGWGRNTLTRKLKELGLLDED